MDVPLKLFFQMEKMKKIFCFNPCFGGCSIKTIRIEELQNVSDGFNPCFGGCSIKTDFHMEKEIFLTGFNPCFGGCSIKTMIFHMEKE